MQRAQIAARAEHVTVRPADLDPHREMRRQCALVEQLRVDVMRATARRSNSSRARWPRLPPRKRRSSSGSGIGRAGTGGRAQLFRQRAQQRDDLLGEPARHEPLERARASARRAARAESQRHAVVVRAGLEFVAQRQRLARDLEVGRVTLRRDLGRLAARDVGGGHRQRAIVRARSRTSASRLDRSRTSDGSRCVVKRRDPGLADEEIALAKPRFPVEDVRPQRAGVHEECGLVIARGGRGQRVGRERIGDEDRLRASTGARGRSRRAARCRS